jgi:hypothetical protein
MKPELRKIINQLELKYGKIKPCSFAGTWGKSISQSIQNDDLVFWFETTGGVPHQVRIDKNWQIKPKAGTWGKSISQDIQKE